MMPAVLSPFDWLTLHGLVTVVAVLIYVVTSHAMHQRRHPTAAIAWILFILLVPYLALPAYLSFGSRKRQRPGLQTHVLDTSSPDRQGWVVDTLLSLAQPAPADYTDLHIHADGREARTALLATLGAARHSIDISTFLFREDALGALVLERLCEKARQGVRVRLLLDGMGSLMGGRPRLSALQAAGGEALLFVPPLHSPLRGRTNLRNHRKLLVVDAAEGQARLWCGGRNLAAEYFEGEPGRAPWHDLSFDLGGPLVQQAASLFEHDWAFAGGRTTQPQPRLAAGAAASAGGQLVASGPDQADDTLQALLMSAAYRAGDCLLMVTPYFVPDTALLSALCLAARRGVAVDLLLPARSNHRLSDLARERALRALVQAGARVWLAPQMLHAKLVVVDEVVALAGSANLDSRSLFLNYELMVAFHGADDVRRFAGWAQQELVSASRYRAQAPGLLRDILEGMLLWTGFEL